MEKFDQVQSLVESAIKPSWTAFFDQLPVPALTKNRTGSTPDWSTILPQLMGLFRSPRQHDFPHPESYSGSVLNWLWSLIFPHFTF
ncbi:hypothetical protein [Crocosphaera chwakensis]|uniref:Uncharacterized protein n=1 Tax=Crocosphaera chwakensis CCY0110 TaxID=391612 RepID=A3IY43_9CHRO|nr:hypothetical protein [Crocosphaera chwakensis]EAZ88619.1 hypothetical protein CY0110_31480 [Crocosphaera chwakensis CCY0110]